MGFGMPGGKALIADEDVEAPGRTPPHDSRRGPICVPGRRVQLGRDEMRPRHVTRDMEVDLQPPSSPTHQQT